MATIKVKFRQFAESEQGGSVYYIASTIAIK